MTQHELIIKYVELNGSITPAKLNDHNRAFLRDWIGSECGKRCRELRKVGRLVSEKDGKYEKFYLKEKFVKWQAQFKVEDNKQKQLF